MALHCLVQQLQHLSQRVPAGAGRVSQPHVEGGPGIKREAANIERVRSTACRTGSMSSSRSTHILHCAVLLLLLLLLRPAGRVLRYQLFKG
jgi:hypothetical protein